MSRRAIAVLVLGLALVLGCGSSVCAASSRGPIMPRQPVCDPIPEQVRLSELKAAGVAERLGWADGQAGPGDVQVMVDPDIPPSKTLSTSGYIPQPDGYTCGPTSAHNLLLNWGTDVSITHLKADLGFTGSSTPMSDKWPTTLNSHSSSSYYVIGWSPGESTTWAAFVGDTLDNHPFILLVLMNESRGYLPGYTHDREWGHYVTGNGYSGYYSGTKYGKYFDQYNGLTGTYGEHSVALSAWIPMLYLNAIVW